MTAVGGIDRDAAGAGNAGAHWRLRWVGRLVEQLEAEQEQWFLWLPVLFGGGIALYFMLPSEPSMMAALLPAIAALALRAVAPRGGIARLASTALLAVALGGAVGKLRTEAVRAPVLVKQVGPIEVQGYIELIEPRPGKGQRLTLRVMALERHPPEQMPYRVRVRTQAENADLKPGDAVRLKATLSPPPGPSLPGDYDFARSAWFQRLGAVGYSVGAAEIIPNAEPPPLGLRVGTWIERARQAIGRRVVEALPGQTGAIANALITGERGGISEATNQAFRDSGLFHILSISGLHMTIMAGAVFFCMRLALAAIPAVALRYPIKKWAAVGAMAGALAYLLISGSAFATVRSYIMISIMFLAVLLDRPAIALRNVALAALAILLLWPESLFDAGFQMSFAAVVALVSAYEWLRARRQEPGVAWFSGLLRMAGLFLGGIVLSTLIASLAVAPFGIYHFHNTQQFAILANLIAIPICNLVVMPAALATLVAMPFGLEAGPLWLMGWGIEAMEWCARRVAALPGAVGRVPAIPTVAFVLIVLGGLWCALWRTRWRVLGVLPIALGLMLAPGGRRPDVLVGRGAELVAVRMADGRLSALAGRGSAFELARWLEHDGDGRPAAEAAKARAFRCDGQGCVARIGDVTVAVAKSPVALRDDCSAARVLILKFEKVRACTGGQGAATLIDVDDLAARGAHALYLENGRVHIVAVADERGERPWALQPRTAVPSAAGGHATETPEDDWSPRGRVVP
jgi:competence protein ComEC